MEIDSNTATKINLVQVDLQPTTAVTWHECRLESHFQP